MKRKRPGPLEQDELYPAVVLIQFLLHIVQADVVRGSPTFCAEPLSRSLIPSEIRVFHSSTHTNFQDGFGLFYVRADLRWSLRMRKMYE